MVGSRFIWFIILIGDTQSGAFHFFTHRDLIVIFFTNHSQQNTKYKPKPKFQVPKYGFQKVIVGDKNKEVLEVEK